MSSKPSDNFFSRPDKTLQWLEESRDSWKEKTKVAKDHLKKQKLAVKRPRNDRNFFKRNYRRRKLPITEPGKN